MPRTKKLPWKMIPVIFSLAGPTMLEQLMNTAVQYIDTAMVGTLGTEATAAVGSTGTVNWLVSSTISALGIGFLALISKAFGAGDKEKARQASVQAVLMTLLSGLFFTALTLGLSKQVPVWMQVDPKVRGIASTYFLIIYTPMLARAASIILGTVLRAAGDTKTPMKVGIFVNLINVVLNFFLIYESRDISLFSWTLHIPGAGMGIIGAAAASAVSYAFGGIAIAVSVWRHPVLSPRGQKFRFDPVILRPCMKIAFPNMLQRFGTALGYVAFASMINSLGEISTAAHTIANTVESAFYIPGYGMQAAAATLAGNAYGARDRKGMKDLARMIMPIEFVLMTISGSLLFCFAPAIMRLFSVSEDVIRLGSTVLRMVALSEPFYGISIIIEGIFLGVGDTLPPFILGISTMWLVRIGGTFLCVYVLGHGLVSAWACMILHNLVLFLLLTIRYLRGRWNPLKDLAVPENT